MPGRGWTYNLWGFDCVKLTLGRKIIRVGTNDAEGRVACERQVEYTPRIQIPDRKVALPNVSNLPILPR